jgi:hypothetical protein
VNLSGSRNKPTLNMNSIRNNRTSDNYVRKYSQQDDDSELSQKEVHHQKLGAGYCAPSRYQCASNYASVVNMQKALIEQGKYTALHGKYELL